MFGDCVQLDEGCTCEVKFVCVDGKNCGVNCQSKIYENSVEDEIHELHL